MDDRTSFSPDRPPGRSLLSTSSPRTDEKTTPPSKRLPPHLRLRLMRQQEEAAAALAAEAQKRKAVASLSSVPSPPQKGSSWKPTTSSPPWTPVQPIEPHPAPPSSKASSGRTTPDGGVVITQHRPDGRLTPPVFPALQKKTVDDKEKIDDWTTETLPEWTAEALPEWTTTIDSHPAIIVQQHPSRPSTPLQLQTPPLPQQAHSPQSIKIEDVFDNENVHPAQNTAMPPNGTPDEAHQVAQPSHTFVENVPSSNNEPNALNVWDCDASEKNSPPQSVKSAGKPPTKANAEETEPEPLPTTSENTMDGVCQQKSLFNMDEEDNIHGEDISLAPVENQTHTQQNFAFARSPVAPTISPERRAESIKATPTPIPVPTPSSPQQGAVLSEVIPGLVHPPMHRKGRESVSSIATNENVNFTGEDIEVVHAIPRPRQYPNPPVDEDVPGYPNPLRAHPVDVFWDGPPPSSTAAATGAAVAAQADFSSENALEATRESRAAMWVHRMSRYRPVDFVGGRVEALRDESLVHHDFYGYPLPLPSDKTTKAGLTAATANNAGGGPAGVIGSARGYGKNADDRGGTKKQPMHYPPMEPTGPLYRVRMKILTNFAARCREAKHCVKVMPHPVVERQGEKAAIEGRHRGRATVRTDAAATSTPVPAITTMTGPCPQCALADEFTMRAQHGQLFLESVLLPMSLKTTYADMMLHVNTSVVERIYADMGMGSALADNPVCPWEDIQTMPVYEDYMGALVLASHRRQVMDDLPMMVDDAGLIKGVK